MGTWGFGSNCNSVLITEADSGSSNSWKNAQTLLPPSSWSYLNFSFSSAFVLAKQNNYVLEMRFLLTPAVSSEKQFSIWTFQHFLFQVCS